ncbi:MAG: DUF3168 domain-containing protein [Sphingobium sp.]
MSGVLALRGVVIAALRGDAALMALVNSVEDGGLSRQSAPALVIGQLFATEWGARGLRGLSVRVPMTVVDRADRPERLEAAAERIEAVMGGLAAHAGDWRVGSVRLDRSRSLRGSDGQWSLLVDYAVRLSRVG